jgi:hypothetical protein
LKYIIDRFEGSYAVCEDEHGKMIHIHRDKISGSAVESDVITLYLNKYMIDENETNKRKKNIQSLADELWSE